MELKSPNSILDLLEVEPGKITKMGERFLLLNTNAMGTLRKDLISMLGSERAKGFFIRYGWSCGYKDASSVRHQFPDAPLSFWLEQGPLLHTLEGVGEAVVTEIRFDRQKGEFYREGYWKNSFEAEQHLTHFGYSDTPVCWMMIGYAGGFCSGAFGKQILYKEIECVGLGDERCSFVGKTVEEWGEECVQDLTYYGESKIAEELEEAHERISQQHQLLQQIMDYHTKLSRLVLNGESRQVIIDELGQMVKAPVVIEDIFLKPLTWYSPGSEQEMSDYFLSSIQDKEKTLLQQLKQVKREKRAHDLVFTNDFSKASRTIAPIILDEEVVGYLSVIHVEGSNNDLRSMLVERAATVFAFDALKEQVAVNTENRIKGEFLEDLLSSSTNKDSLQNRSRVMGYNFDLPHRFLIIGKRTSLTMDMETKKEKEFIIRKELFDSIRAIINTFKKNALIVERREDIIVLFESDENDRDIDMMISNIENRYQEIDPDFLYLICISRVSQSIQELHEVFKEAKNTQDVMMRLGRKNGRVYVEKTTLFDRLYLSSSQDQFNQYAEEFLEKLLEYDEKYSGGQFIQTLFVYLENECNLQKTCRDMNISSSGLKYRIRRIQEIGEINLDNPEERFTIQLAIRVLSANGRIPYPGL